METILKKILMTATALVATVSAAVAADLPRKTAPAPAFVTAAPVFSWTGFYVGLNAGAQFGDSRTNTIGTPAFLALVPAGTAPGRLSKNSAGFIGGAQIGYNWQLGNYVAGLEADIQYVDGNKTSSFTGLPVLGTRLTTSAKSELEYFGTLRGRLGYTPFDRLLVYATGGLAYGSVKSNASVVGVDAPALAWSGSKTDQKFGWTVGAGAEYALTSNWTIKGEYLYYDLGRSTVSAFGNGAVRANAALNGIDYVGRTQNRGSIVRAGLNYKF
jgi:outer membrane immunogenic protein